MKLIHCADIHLDSPLSSNLTRSQAIKRNEELLENFIKIMDYAVDNNVRAVLIAGDLFDTKNVSSLCYNRVIEEIKKHSSVDFLYLCGNHDEMEVFEKMTAPENLKLFSGAGKAYRYGAVVITGLNRLQLPPSLNFKEDDTNIVMMHGQIDNFNVYAGKNIDYMALGHIHKYVSGTIDGRGDYCYSGCMEARGFDECGEKGFVLLDTQRGYGKKILHEFVPFAKRTAWEIIVDISENDKTTQVYEKIKKNISEISVNDMIRIVLTGNSGNEQAYDIEYLKTYLEKEYYLVNIKDETRQKSEKSGFEEYFIESIMRSGETEKMKQEIIKCAKEVLNC